MTFLATKLKIKSRLKKIKNMYIYMCIFRVSKNGLNTWMWLQNWYYLIIKFELSLTIHKKRSIYKKCLLYSTYVVTQCKKRVFYIYVYCKVLFTYGVYTLNYASKSCVTKANFIATTNNFYLDLSACHL